MNPTRPIVIAVAVAALGAGAALLATSVRTPDDGREANVGDAPAGGRTQATPVPPGGSEPVEVPDDPLAMGVPESPDIPSSEAHRGVKKIGERIRDKVLEDGAIGDEEVPGVSLAGLTAAQRRFFVDEAIGITCGCGCRQDLLECRRDDLTCPVSPALRDSLLAVARGRT